MTPPTFSVIIPVYNAHETLAATVASVLDQSDSDWQMILVDDGSTDFSLRTMLEFACQDDRIRAVSQSNKGPSVARNLGAELASGRYLAFLDADDLWATDKLARHRSFHDTLPALGASFAKTEFVESDAQGRAKANAVSTVPNGALSLSQVIAENPVCTTSNLVISAAAFQQLGGFCESMVHAEDQEFVARYVANGYSIAGIDAALVQYAMMESGLSADLEAMLDGWRTLAENYCDRINMNAAEAIYCRYLARRALRTGARPSVALSYAREGLRLDSASFFADRRRGLMTLVASLACTIMPRSMRRRVFA